MKQNTTQGLYKCIMDLIDSMSYTQTIHRNAINGETVTAAYAAMFPDTTVTEHRKVYTRASGGLQGYLRNNPQLMPPPDLQRLRRIFESLQSFNQ